MAAGAVRDRFGTVHPAGPRFRSRVCYYFRMATRAPRIKADKPKPVATKAKAVAKTPSKPKTPKTIEPTAHRTPDHDEEW